MIALLAALLFTNTERVSALAAAGEKLWAATAGGVERYDLRSGVRERLYTTADGLDSNAALEVRQDGVLHVRTAGSLCRWTEGDLFRCAGAPARPPPFAGIVALHRHARVTARLLHDGHEILATDGAGIWLDGRRITPLAQLCANHVEALAEFQGALWVGTFDAGLCALEGGRFRAVEAPFRMINDLRPTPRGLWIAAAEGLFFTSDGRTFRRENGVRERGVNRIAVAPPWLLVTTPVALYALRLDGADQLRRWRTPAGSTRLQAGGGGG